MSCPTGLNAGLFIRAETGAVPTSKVGTEWKSVKDVSTASTAATADVSSRASAGFREQCSTLKDLTVEITAQYKASDAVLGIVRAAFIGNSLVDASILTSAGSSYEGIVGRFAVTAFGLDQPLEEGQTIPITLTLNKFGAWLNV